MATSVTPLAAAVLSALISSGILREDIASFAVPPVLNPVVPAVPSVGRFGLNLGGSVDPLSDPTLHPSYLKAFTRFAPGGVARVWFTASLSGTMPISQFAVAGAYDAAGVDLLGVINFQNSAVRCMAPPMADWLQYINSFPTALVSGFKYIEIGNELDSKTYWADTSANYAALLAAAYPILKAKGYIVVAGNCTNFNTTNFINYDMAKYGMFANCDAIGVHLYTSDAASALAGYQRLLAFAATVGKLVICTEVGLHMNPGDIAAWAAQIQLLIAGLKTLAGIWIYFSMYQLPATAAKAGPEGLLLPNDTDNVPFTTAWTNALAA